MWEREGVCAGEYTYTCGCVCTYIKLILSQSNLLLLLFFSMVSYTCTQWVLSSQPHPSSTLVGVTFEPKLIGCLIKSSFIIHHSSFINQERKPHLYSSGHHSLKVQKTHQRPLSFYLLTATVLSMLRKAHILAFQLYNAYPRASKCISKL